MRLKLVLVTIFFIQFQSFTQNYRVSILDIRNYSSEIDEENLFSIDHALTVAGLPYDLFYSFSDAKINSIVIIPSTIESGYFNDLAIDSMKNFVTNGGVIIFTQVKDLKLNSLIGVSSYSYSTNRKKILGNLSLLNDESYLLDRQEEVDLQLTDSSLVSGIATRGYQISTGVSLAQFDDQSKAIVKNQYGSGFTYLFGLNWNDYILRNQVGKDFKAARYYSNGFEIGSDFFYFLLRGIYEKYVPFAVTKHTSVSNSNSLLVITHDVDATSAIADIMTDFSSYEYENNIRATYFVTTHYNHDSIAKDFWTGYADQITSVKNKGHEIASHSVSHVPDFDNSSIVQLGDCNSVEHANYYPFYDGTKSNDVTVCGEVSVSKQLLKEAVDVEVKSFRAGYLAYNKNLLEGLESMNYQYNSSNSANNILTSFPYQGHLTLSMSSPISSILEIPNTISDVFMENRISEDNYMEKVAVWKSVQERNASNHAPTVLLIHPNRSWKVIAEQSFIRGLSTNTAIIPFEEYGAYWKDRQNTDFDFKQTPDSNLTIKVNLPGNEINKKLSFIVKNGMMLKEIQVVDSNQIALPFIQTKIHENDKLISFSKANYNHTIFTYDETSKLINLQVYPNPSTTNFNFKFSLINDAEISITIFDELGNRVEDTPKKHYELGNYQINNSNKFESGMYFYKLSVDDKLYYGKLIVN